MTSRKTSRSTLKGNQKRLDANGDGRISGRDFAILRMKRTKQNRKNKGSIMKTKPSFAAKKNKKKA